MLEMDMHSRKQYLKRLRDDYLKASKKEKGELLDRYVKDTKHNRKYVINKLNSEDLLVPPKRNKRTRKGKYGPEINWPLVELWKIFDFACGQRLKPAIETELERLRQFGELHISDETAKQLKSISSATIDRRLKTPRKKIGPHASFSTTRPGSLLKNKIPIRLTDWDTTKVGYCETDLVAHCGDNVFGQYLHTVSLTEIATGWWEGEAIMGKGERVTFAALKDIRARCPFNWRGLDSDNGGEFINKTLWKYCDEEKIEFTRSRENKKNDNAYVEQKNWTHVRKLLGRLRHDSVQEQIIINKLYRNEVRLYKNFFQPVMKLAKKERIGSKRIVKHEPAKTPYRRIIDSDQVDEKIKEALKASYETLNPAELKRRIDEKVYFLYQTYRAKQKARQKPSARKITLRKGVARVGS